MDQQAIVDKLGQFGFGTYEAKLLIAVQRIGSGTASELAEVADIPRSQVYGAADTLEAKGMLGVQDAQPTVYKSVSVNTIETVFQQRLTTWTSEITTYLEQVERDQAGSSEMDAVYRLQTPDGITAQFTELVQRATETVTYTVRHPADIPEPILTVLEAVAADGVTVDITYPEQASDELPAVVRTGHVQPVAVPELPTHSPDGWNRIATIDHHTFLLSILPADERQSEQAFWSESSQVGRVLTQGLQAMQYGNLGETI